ncbi:WYL domain-containing protein [Clostridium sp. 29_15]|nr:WYL domain-containing protein [Clostridium sp. 29_15]
MNYSILNSKKDFSAEIIPYSRIRDDFNISKFEGEIYEAILDKNEIIISYKSNRGIITRRKVQPFKLFIYKGEYYLIAKCLTKNDIRYFKLTRIKDMIKTSFKFVSDFNVDVYLKDAKENSLGIFFEKSYNIKLIVYPPMANTISERIWVDNQVITEFEDGRILFEATMKGGPEIVSWILSMQSHVEVLEPQSLKEELKEELEKMIKKLKV